MRTLFTIYVLSDYVAKGSLFVDLKLTQISLKKLDTVMLV